MLRSLPLIASAFILLAAAARADHHGEGAPPPSGAQPVRVLMMTGQNNHKWKETTPVLKQLIESSGRFELTIDKQPWEFGPDAFADCDVVMSNWSMWPKLKEDPWSPATKSAFLRFIRDGGGLVVMHAGSSVHYQWPEFQALVGRTWRRGKTYHGPKHEFRVIPAGGHPITRGVEPFTIFDELWRRMDPTGPYETIAVADTVLDKKNPGPLEPMLITTKLGKGRGVNVVLGHDTRSLSNESLQTLLLRSLEWAATGEVE